MLGKRWSLHAEPTYPVKLECLRCPNAHLCCTLKFQCCVCFQGEVLAFDAETGRQHVLYSDGEDERLLLHQESVQWHKLQLERQCYTVGLPEGVSCLRGAAVLACHMWQDAALPRAA